MKKIIEKPNKRDSETAIRVKRTADMCGVSTRHVYRVIEGSRVDEKVMSIYMKLSDGENLLLDAVKKAVSFN